MAEIREYKCPNCGGAVVFDSASQKMKCPYCDAEFEAAALEAYQQEKETGAGPSDYSWNTTGEGGETFDLGESYVSQSCPSCGAEIIGDKNTAAKVCPYCGNTNIVTERLEGILKPDFVVPFALDKKAARAALEGFYQHKRLLPDFFKQENRIDSVTGIYVPFWLFNAGAHGRGRFKGVTFRRWSDARYDYSESRFYAVVRDGSLAFEKVPVDGSEKMEDAYMDAIEPFDYSGLLPFSPAYLSGFLAEKYDVDAEKAKDRANERIKNSVEKEFLASVTGYNSVTTESLSVQLQNGQVHYALLPVWMLNTVYKGKNYLFAMNGQTGRLVGKLPADGKKIARYLLTIGGVAGVLSTAVLIALGYLL